MCLDIYFCELSGSKCMYFVTYSAIAVTFLRTKTNKPTNATYLQDCNETSLYIYIYIHHINWVNSKKPEGQSAVDQGHKSLCLLYPQCSTDVSADSLRLIHFPIFSCKTLFLPANNNNNEMCKSVKYVGLDSRYIFQPIGVESLHGPDQ